MKKLFVIFLSVISSFSCLHAQVWKLYTTSEGLVNNSVKCQASDNSGNLWIGTTLGVSKFNGTTFTNYNTTQGIPSNFVRALCCDAADVVWLGTQSGLSKFDGSVFTNYNVTNGMPSNVVTSLAPASGGILWIGLASTGISKFNGTTFTNYNTSNGLVSNSITTLCVDMTGKLWIGTNAGISVFDGTTFTNYNTGNGLPSNGIKALYCDATGNVWIGTVAGLTKYNGSIFSTLTTVNGLLGNSITTIDKDDSGNMWIGYNVYGVSKYDGITFTHFNEYNGYLWNNASSIKCLNNYMYVGTGEGLLEFKKWINPPYRFDYLDTNCIAAGINACGLLFEKPDQTGGFLVPKNTGLSSLFASSVWFGGFDQNNQLHLAAQRFLNFDNDISTGPLFADMNTYEDDSIWNRIWKISKAEIDYHILNYNQTGYVIPKSISEWPAPTVDYVDVNSNHLYDPLNGDYPLIRGDQAILTIYNDLATPHSSGGLALGVEVHSLSYSFNSPDSALANTVFNNYKIYNYSSNSYSDFYLGVYSDIDVGIMSDDFIGCDSALSSYFGYNGTAYDADYGEYIPAQGVVFLSSPMYSFNYYSNNSGAMGDPVTSAEFYNVLNGYWKDGTPYTYGGTGYGGTVYTNYCFSSDPNNAGGWSEVTENNTPADRRGVGTVGPFTLLAGKTLCIDVAFPNAIRGNNLISVTLLHERISQIIQFYDTQSWQCGEIFVDTSTVPRLYAHDVTICKNQPFQISNFVVGGIPPYAYNWSPATGLSSSSVLNPMVTLSQTMEYILTVTDNLDSVIIDTILVSISNPYFFAGNDTTMCSNESLTLTASSGFFNYWWYGFGSPTQSINLNTNHNLSGIVNVMAFANDSLGCSTSDTVLVTFLPSPDVDFADNTVLCNTETFLLDAGAGADHYLWNTGATSNSILLDGSIIPLGVYIYDVYAWNDNGCNSYDTISVTVTDVPDVFAGTDTTVCSNESVLLTATAGFSNYQWSCCGNTQSINVNTNHDNSGTVYFTVIAHDISGCSDTDTVAVTFLSSPDVNLWNDTILCNTETLLLDAGAGADHYLWNTGAVSNSVLLDGTVLSLGYHTYNVHAWNDNGCNSYDTITVDVQVCSGIKDLSDEGFKVFPNPSEGIFYIESNQAYFARITDIKGDLVYSKLLPSGKERVSLKNISQGIYLLELQTKQRVLKTKLVLY